MSKVRFFFSVFCVIQLFICSSKISYAVSPAGATDDRIKVDPTVTPGVTEVTIAQNVRISTPQTTSERCNHNNIPFCSWQEIEIRGEGKQGYINVAFDMTYKIANVEAKSPSGKKYNIEVFLVSNNQAVLNHRTMYTSAHDMDGHAGHILNSDSFSFDIPRFYSDYQSGQFIPDKALNKNNSSTAYWASFKCPLYKCTLDLYMGLGTATIYSIKARIPSGFNESELYFEDAEVLNLSALTKLNWDDINTNGNGGKARFLVSGTIKFPQTCAFSLSKSEIHFGTVEAKYENGELGNTQSVDLMSTCTSLDHNARIAYTITPDGGTGLEDNDTVAVLERTESNSKALGLIFGFDNDTIDCFGSGRQYSWQHVFNNLKDPGNSKTKLNFKLCQYGLPKSYGEKSKKFNIRIKWLPPTPSN
ncbi:hypothetical protein KEP82_24595 [Escherichia coli]|nr:hypothetical protein [Escherichia coli]